MSVLPFCGGDVPPLPSSFDGGGVAGIGQPHQTGRTRFAPDGVIAPFGDRRECGVRPTPRPCSIVDDVAMAGVDSDDDLMRLLTSGRDREAAQRGAALGRSVGADDNDGGAMDPVAQLTELAPALAGVIGGLRPDQLDQPTPCAEFTVRGVLEHMILGATAFSAAYRGEAPSDPDLEEPLLAVQAALGDLVASIGAPGALDRSIDGPFGEVDGESFARFVVLDGLVHGWDLATATGQGYEPSDELVAAASAYARGTLDPLRDGQTFKGALEPATDATPIERLAAYTGRTVPAGSREAGR
jgi:uncharacterized protein (TIGR03086 family)